MKKLLINLFLILGVLAIAQNKRFIYEYKFISDSTNVDDVKTEMMFLDTTKDGSKYYSYTVFNSDSIMKVDLEKQLAATGSINVKSDMRKGDVRYSVTKTYPDYKINLHRRLGMDAYNISDDRKINWKISSEKEKIGEWNAQKAEADFAGRKWIAWFSTEIPIQDGPYKFHGLPGLIVALNDFSNTYVFRLVDLKKEKREITQMKNAVNTTFEKFAQARQDSKDNAVNQVQSVLHRSMSDAEKDLVKRNVNRPTNYLD